MASNAVEAPAGTPPRPATCTGASVWLTPPDDRESKMRNGSTVDTLVAPAQTPVTSMITSVATLLVMHHPDGFTRIVIANEDTGSAFRAVVHRP